MICVIVYHVTSPKKYKRYMASGCIKAPVRAWENIQQAERFSKQTGRTIILRLKFPDDASKYEGHFNQARVIYNDYPLF